MFTTCLCPQGAPHTGEHHVYLPLSPSPKPELAPLGGESGDQLSHLQYHPPPGHLGPALSPRGTLLASCPVVELPLPPSPELLSLGRSDSVGSFWGNKQEDFSLLIQPPSRTFKDLEIWSCGLLPSPRPKPHFALPYNPVWPHSLSQLVTLS